MSSNWGKLIAVYVLAVLAAVGSLAHGATAMTVTPAQIQLAGDYLNRPLVADVFCDTKDAEFTRVWAQLAALKFKRHQAIGKREAALLGELAKLRSEHKDLMNARNGTGGLDDSFERQSKESGWSMSITDNVTRQVELKAKLAKLSIWDEAHPFTVRYRMRGGKKVLVRLEGDLSGFSSELAIADGL